MIKIKNSITGICFTAIALLACNSEAQKTDLSVTEFEKKLAEQKGQLLDVRTAGEFEGGHLKNALQADWTNPEQFKQRVKALDKNIPVYTYCLSGGRSGAATKWLNDNGYTAFNMKGGVNSWNQQDKPIEQVVKASQMSLQEYEQLIPSDKTVLVDMGATWCPPCKKMDVIIKELQESHGDKFMLVKIDAGAQTSLMKEMNVEELPTFIVYKNGKAVWTKSGLVEKQTLIQNL